MYLIYIVYIKPFNLVVWSSLELLVIFINIGRKSPVIFEK